MFKDQKVQLSIAGFLLFFIAAALVAWKFPEMRAQFNGFVFMGLGAMYTAIWAFVKPDGGNDKTGVNLPPPAEQVRLSQPDTGASEND